MAADKYRERSLEHQDTAQRCLENSVRYEPLVFTTQGAIQKNAEAIISELAGAVAKAEGRHEAIVKAEIIQDICLRLTRSAAKAVARRAPRIDRGGGDEGARLREEMEVLSSEQDACT